MALVESQSGVDRRVGPALTADASNSPQNVGDATHHTWAATVGPVPPSPAQVRFTPQLEKLTLTLLTTSLLRQVPSILPNTYEPRHQTLLVIFRTFKYSPRQNGMFEKEAYPYYGHMRRVVVIPAGCGQAAVIQGQMLRYLVHRPGHHYHEVRSTR